MWLTSHIHSGRRTYTLYIMYSTYYRTPRLYLSGYSPNGQPLPPHAMMDDIVGDYKDKTVTLEDFPFFANNIKMASVHPCKHASVMKTMLDRADGALRIRREKLRAGKAVGGDQGMEGLVDELGKLDVKDAQAAADKDGEWEEVEQSEVDEQEVAIRVDQYLVVFLKVHFSRREKSSRVMMMLTCCSSWPASHLVSSTISQWEYKWADFSSASLSVFLLLFSYGNVFGNGCVGRRQAFFPMSLDHGDLDYGTLTNGDFREFSRLQSRDGIKSSLSLNKSGSGVTTLEVYLFDA